MTSIYGVPIEYTLSLSDQEILLNQFLGQTISIRYLNKIHCIRCGRETKTSFAQGYCYPCFTTAPETEDCVLRPELCQAHEGIARDLVYAENHCLINHVVYLALSDKVKVGVTRHTQVPVRWIDQGAWKVIQLAVTPNRYLAGMIEVDMKQHFRDKTNWRKMLTNELDQRTILSEVKEDAIKKLHKDYVSYISPDNTVWEMNYPVLHYPTRVISLNLEKTALINDQLTGIKGQYLLFGSGAVLNIRKFGGYQVEFTFPDH